MRKIVILTAVLAALAAAAPASGATLMAKACHTSCSSFSADGSGTVSIVANGAEWGTMSSGTIWMRDRTGNGNPRNWVHGKGLHSESGVPVLKNLVDRLLRQRADVLAFASAPAAQGGHGAVLVLLNRRR